MTMEATPKRKDFLITWIEHANNFVNYYLNQGNFKYENITGSMVWFW